MVATNSMATRSSLELMLDKLQHLEDQPKDNPPALPVRPVSRARLPPARRPLQLDLQRRKSQESDASFKWGGFESKRTKKEGNIELFHHENSAESNGFAASAALEILSAQFDHDHLQKGIEILENSKEIAEKGISNIQKCYRGHQVRCYYKELRRGVIAIQSFVRGENTRRGYQNRIKRLSASILIQKQTRKHFERRAVEEQNAEGLSRDSKSPLTVGQDCTQVPYGFLIDLQKQVLRTEAKVREKTAENIALKLQLDELEKKWQQYEERMKSMEKTWQDQFTYLQKCLAAARKNPAPNDKGLDFPTNSVHRQIDRCEFICDEDNNLNEVGQQKLHHREELRKLKLGFKAWKKDYKNKLRDAQSMLKKLGNSETAKGPKNWWGRLSY